MELGERTKRAICARYYLDMQPISQIARELRVTREDVRDAIDDPAAQEAFLQRADRARTRQRIRAVSAAESALDRQAELLKMDVCDELKPTQQRTAENVLRRALPPEREDRHDIRIRFTGGEIELGMPESWKEGFVDDD